ncbi:MAG: hypothetical protein LKK00_04905 [Intestinimonas sp.]|jgi:hypothetical protein|nr:hypothetical protein [Intestinimonas sp.]
MANDVTQETLDIFAKRVLAKAELLQTQETYQENYTGTTPLGTKAPLRLYIINHGATESQTPNTNYGSPVKCVKLCKRVLDDDPENTIICTQKSRVTINYELVLIVEYEDKTFDVLTLPKNLSQRLHYSAASTKAFVDSTVIDSAGTPVVQHQNTVQPYEMLVIKFTGINAYTNFQYTVNIPISSFSAILKKCELEDPTLQSYIVLRNLDYEVDVLDQFQVYTAADQSTSIWTTIVDFSLYEDIIDKLGIDQDIQIVGTPEYVCEDTNLSTCSNC